MRDPVAGSTNSNVLPLLRLVTMAAALGALGTTSPASAQVTTNQGALDALGSSHHAAPAHAAPHAGGHHRDASRTTHAARPGVHATARPPRAVNPHPPAATIPPAPPPPPVFRAPIINVPLHPPPPPPPVPVVQTAIGTATPIDNGVRISFGPGSADLNPATMQALHRFSDQLKSNPTARADLDATSVAMPDDPSTPRRTALSRGLAARAVLINDGVPSTRIYVRVLGQMPAGADRPDMPDRVDLQLSQTPGETQAPAAPAPALGPALSPAAGPPSPGAPGQ